MKKIILTILLLIVSINVFAKTDVERQVEQIREEFTKINSEKNYKIEDAELSNQGNTVVMCYKKSDELKKIIVSLDATLENYHFEYYLKNNKVFFIYESKNDFKMKEDGTFDEKSLRKTEKRYYFDENKTLIRYIENGKIYDKGNIPQKYDESAKDALDLISELE